MAVKKVWGLGERICRNDFKRRWNLFRYLVQSIIEYGVEIWGWEEKPELEKIMFDYVRWMFGIEFCTPRYLISRELGLLKLSTGWGLRANRFEYRIQLGLSGKIARECWLEKEQYGWCDKYGEEKDKYRVRVEWETYKEDRFDWNRTEMERQVIEKERNNLRREEEEKIMKAKFNPRYKEIKVIEGCPNYLKEGNLENMEIGEEIKALIKLRCGNFENANKYWLKEEFGLCVFCKKTRDTLNHYVGECERIKTWFNELGNNVEERLKRLWGEDLDRCKGKILKKLEKERMRRVRGKE